MKRVWSSFLVVALMVALAPGWVSPARAAAPGIAEDFSPQTGVIFNNPDTAQAWDIVDYVASSVAVAPPGSVIRIAVYSFYQQDLADLLIAAHARGVHVRLLIDNHTTTPQITQLTEALGGDRKAESFVVRCQQGCMSVRTSYMHAKLYLFSTSGTAKRVTMIGSGNPTRGGHALGWNNHYTVVGDLPLYASSIRYFDDMLADRTNTTYYRTTTSGPYRAYYFPRAGKTVKSDTFYQLLSNVRCTGAAPGHGINGRTVIRVAMYLWTDRRVDIAKRLWELQNEGCDVQVVYTQNAVQRGVSVALLKKTPKNGRIKLWNGLRDRDGNGIKESYVHSKYILVDGVYGTNPASSLVWTGSANFGMPSLREGNEVTLKISGDAIHQQFNDNFALLRSISTLVTKVPSEADSLGHSGGQRSPLALDEDGGTDLWADDDLGHGAG